MLTVDGAARTGRLAEVQAGEQSGRLVRRYTYDGAILTGLSDYLDEVDAVYAWRFEHDHDASMAYPAMLDAEYEQELS